METTRNRNMKGNLNLENIQNLKVLYHRTHPYRIQAYETRFPEFGINQGQIPSSSYVRNGVDVESYLKGIGFTNIGKYEMKYKYNVTPDTKDLKSLHFFEKPESNHLLPQPFLVERNQRPFIP